MIDPTRITNFDRTESELEEFLLFCIMVAGKQSRVEAKKLDALLSEDTDKLGPFLFLGWEDFCGTLGETLRRHKIAPYASRLKSFREAWRIKCPLKQIHFLSLIEVYGISHKTANFFLTHSRRGHDYPVLDTHILSFLRDKGFPAPKHSPQNAVVYAKWAKVFSDIAAEEGLSVAELDLRIWKERSKKD